MKFGASSDQALILMSRKLLEDLYTLLLLYFVYSRLRLFIMMLDFRFRKVMKPVKHVCHKINCVPVDLVYFVHYARPLVLALSVLLNE